MHRGFVITASVLGAITVILGAFGAHSLKQILPPESVATFDTGVRYQFYHVFALLTAGILYEKYRDKKIIFAGYAFIVGIILFSGSLYLLTIVKATNTVGLSGLGMITPFGGLFFIAGWILLALAARIRKT